MYRRLVITVATIAALVLVIAVPLAAAQGAPRNFVAPLSGDQEVPPVDTAATGVAVFQLSHDGTELGFRLIVANIENVTQAHIHGPGARGVNAPVVVWLYPEGPPPVLIEGRTDGVLATGTITAGDLVDTLAGQDLDSLVDMILAGEAYVNVHTTQFPAGEVRGQIDVPRGRIPAG